MTGTALMHTNTVPRLIALPGVHRPQADTRLLASALALRGSADLCGGGHGRGPRRNGPGRRDYRPLRPFHGRRVHVPPQPYVPWCNTSRRSPRESQGGGEERGAARTGAGPSETELALQFHLVRGGTAVRIAPLGLRVELVVGRPPRSLVRAQPSAPAEELSSTELLSAA